MAEYRNLTLFLTIVTCLVLHIYWRNNFTPLEPVLLNKDAYVKLNADSSLNRTMKQVLDFYKVDYRTDTRGHLLVARKLNVDRLLICSYTEKALDTTWLRSH